MMTMPVSPAATVRLSRFMRRCNRMLGRVFLACLLILTALLFAVLTTMPWVCACVIAFAFMLLVRVLMWLGQALPAIGVIISMSVLITFLVLFQFKPSVYRMLQDEPERLVDLLVNSIRVTLSPTK